MTALRLVKPVDDPPAHPAASLFQLMPYAELKELADDIAVNGQKHPIVLFAGQILDGRNRLAACKLAGASPQYETLAVCESPTSYVLSTNLRRRHLTPVERAAIAVSDEVLGPLREEAEARQRAAGLRGEEGGRGKIKTLTAEPEARVSDGRRERHDAVAVAAKLAGTSPETAYQMQQVKRVAPEVYERALRGEIATVADARREAGTVKPSTDPRVIRRRENDEKIAAMLADGHNQAETARALGLQPTTVSDSARRYGTKNPLAGPLAVVRETSDSLATMTDMFKPQWDTATAEQRKDLIANLETLIAASRKFMNRIKQGN